MPTAGVDNAELPIQTGKLEAPVSADPIIKRCVAEAAAEAAAAASAAEALSSPVHHLPLQELGSLSVVLGDSRRTTHFHDLLFAAQHSPVWVGHETEGHPVSDSGCFLSRWVMKGGASSLWF